MLKKKIHIGAQKKQKRQDLPAVLLIRIY